MYREDSPILVNVFLHCVLDKWSHRKWSPKVPAGEAIIIRGADDFVVGLQNKRDAERCLHDLWDRLARFGPGFVQEKTTSWSPDALPRRRAGMP